RPGRPGAGGPGEADRRPGCSSEDDDGTEAASRRRQHPGEYAEDLLAHRDGETRHVTMDGSREHHPGGEPGNEQENAPHPASGPLAEEEEHGPERQPRDVEDRSQEVEDPEDPAVPA